MTYTIPPDTTAPVISPVTTVPTPSTDTTPTYTFTTDEAGTITYGGDCSSSTTSAVIGSNPITFTALADGTHSNCTITVTDASTNVSNILAVNSFTIDTTGPVISEIPPALTLSNIQNPQYSFNSTEAGTVSVVGGACSGGFTSSSVSAGDNTLTFNALAGSSGGVLYSDCTLVITDALGNISNTLDISDFTIDTSALPLAITLSDYTIKLGDTPTVSFTFSESPI